MVAGQSDDSTCCRFDSVGAFGGSSQALEQVAFVADVDSAASAWNPRFQWGYRMDARQRWFDLKRLPGGGFVTVGAVADTVLFTGTRRIWRQGWAPDSTDGYDSRAILAAGGGGGVGIGFWSDTGMALRLLRSDGYSRWPMGWQIVLDAARVIVVGRFESATPGVVMEGVDSFPYAPTSAEPSPYGPPGPGACFAYRVGNGADLPWWTSLPCVRWVHPEAARTPRGLWMTYNDSFPEGVGDPSGISWYDGIRPGLARLDPASGAILEHARPMGSMEGVVRSLASDEAGSLLLQGEQASVFRGESGSYPPILDTLVSDTPDGALYGVAAGWMALLDPTARLVRFRQLHGLEDLGGWKLRRVPGIGWLALSWDEKDLLGWSKLYLFDDSLRLIDSTPRLPYAFDVELGAHGEILLAGRSRESDSAVPWLRGSGSMWVASCRLGSESTVVGRGGGATTLQSRVHRGSLEITGAPGVPIRVRGTDPRGGIWLDRVVATGTRLDLPRGLSIVVVEQEDRVHVQRTLVP